MTNNLNADEQGVLLAQVLDQVRDHAVLVVDSGGHFIMLNRSVSRVFGYSEDEMTGGDLAMLYPPENRNPDRLAEMLQIAGRRGAVEERVVYRRRSGQQFQGHTTITPIGTEGHFAVLVRDLSVLIATQEQLHAMATADQITGLANRQHLYDLGRVEYRRWRRYRVPLTMLIADVDRLRDVNETYGIDAGDDVLRDVADVLRQCVRDVDLVARLEGGTFVALLFSTPLEGGAVLAERIRNNLRRTAFRLNGQATAVTMSLAVLTANEEAPDFDALYKQAEAALRLAKDRGGDCISIA